MERYDVEWSPEKKMPFIDLKTGKIYIYPDEKIHLMFGGKCYYISRSGASGKGWLPKQPCLKKLGVYRPEVRGGNKIWEESDKIGGYKIFIPLKFNEEEERIKGNYVICVKEENNDVFLLNSMEEILPFLKGEISFPFHYEDDLVYYQIERECLLAFSIYMQEKVVNYIHYLKLVFYNDLQFIINGPWPMSWKRLGIYPFNGYYYKVVGGICCQRSTVWPWLEALPKNIYLIDHSSYIEEGSSENEYVLHNLFDNQKKILNFEGFLSLI